MRRLILAAATSAIALAAPATAALAPGAKAPNFATRGAIAGKPFAVNLATQLKKGPVVLYFFPAANTKGCNAEAQAFAAAIPEFKKQGAQVIGMSADTVETLTAFSAKECAGMFPVASAGPAVVKGYDVALGRKIAVNGGPEREVTNRTSYVIAPDGRIVFTHSEMSPNAHVVNTLAALKDWRARNPKRS